MSAPPVFPDAPDAYDRSHFDRFVRMLTLYLRGETAPVNSIYLGNNGVFWTSGNGTPETFVAAPIGSLYSRLDGSTSTTLYVKTSGTGNTGWTAK